MPEKSDTFMGSFGIIAVNTIPTLIYGCLNCECNRDLISRILTEHVLSLVFHKTTAMFSQWLEDCSLCLTMLFWNPKKQLKKERYYSHENRTFNMPSNHSIVRGLEFIFYILKANSNKGQFLMQHLLKRDI